MTHYICTGGCKGESEEPKVCGVETCAKHGQPFEVCDCEDGKHFGKLDQDASTVEPNGPTSSQS